MHSGRNRHKRIGFNLALLFAYLPFLIIQFSYKFYVVANFYFFLHHQAYITAKVQPSCEFNKIEKQKTYAGSYYDPSHLSLDKRYHHKGKSDGDFYRVVITVPLTIEASTEFFTTVSALATHSFDIFSPRGPPFV